MLSKNDIKHIRSLSLAKNRKAYNCFIAEGNKVVHELLEGGLNILNIYGVQENELFHSKNNFLKISEKELNRMSQLKSPNDVLAIVEIPKVELPLAEDLSKTFVLACDRIQDPGNLGTIVRTADWFGIEYVLCSKECADIYGPKALQATMGSISRVNVLYVDLPLILNELLNDVPTLNIISTSLKGVNLSDFEAPNNGVIVLGNESKGISQEIQAISNVLLKIPGKGKAESLNVSVAAGIVISALQMKKSNPQR